MTRTQGADAGTWTPFDPGTDETPSATPADASLSTDQRTDTRTGQTVRSSTAGRHGLRVIDGGQSTRSAFDAAADEALAAASDVDEETVEATVVDPVSETGSATGAESVETPAAAPVETPAETVSGADSTLPTPHPDQEDPERENAAHAGTEEAETPHSTPAWHAFAASLNPSGVLFRQQASLEEIVRYASDAPYSTSPAARALEVAWNRAVAVPVSLLLYSAAAAYKRLWRGLGTSTIGVLWIVAVHASPWDTQTVWTWTLLGYWAVSAFLVPVIVTTRK